VYYPKVSLKKLHINMISNIHAPRRYSLITSDINTKMLCDDQNKEDRNKEGTEIDHRSHRRKMSKKNKDVLRVHFGIFVALSAVNIQTLYRIVVVNIN
jgi:hypothetical protein